MVLKVPLPRPTFHPKWRLRELPRNLHCKKCGDVEPGEVECQLPIDAITVGLNRFLMLAGLVAIGVLVIAFLVANVGID